MNYENHQTTRNIESIGATRIEKLGAAKPIPKIIRSSEDVEKEARLRSLQLITEEYGACRDADPETFFAEQGVNHTAAKIICRSACEVLKPCEAYVAESDSEPIGVMAGMSPREQIVARKKYRESKKSGNTNEN